MSIKISRLFLLFALLSMVSCKFDQQALASSKIVEDRMYGWINEMDGIDCQSSDLSKYQIDFCDFKLKASGALKVDWLVNGYKNGDLIYLEWSTERGDYYRLVLEVGDGVDGQPDLVYKDHSICYKK